MARGNGIITNDERAEIDIIRGIRNHFGHNFERVTFEDEKTKEQCEGPKAYERIKKALPADIEVNHTTRDRFVMTVTEFAHVLNRKAAGERDPKIMVNNGEHYFTRASVSQRAGNMENATKRKPKENVAMTPDYIHARPSNDERFRRADDDPVLLGRPNRPTGRWLCDSSFSRSSY